MRCVNIVSAILLASSATQIAAQTNPPQTPQAKIHASLERVLATSGQDRPVKAWVLFRSDKGIETPAAYQNAIKDLHSTYDPRAIERRQLRRARSGIFDLADVPVPPEYVEAVRAAGADVRVISRWVNGVSAWATQEQIERIASLPFVEKIQPVRRGRSIDPIDVAVSAQAGPAPSDAGSLGFYGEAAAQLGEINLIALHDQGFTGSDVRIGVLDTGFKRTHVAFNEPGHEVDIIAEYDFINDDPVTSYEPGDPGSQHRHGTLILGTLGAYRPNELVGAAYDASFILCKTEDTSGEYEQEEDFYVAGLEFIEANGGDVATSSLSYLDWYTQEDLDGLTAVTTIAVNTATANGLHCCTAASNNGHDSDPSTSHLGAPADALGVITVGAAYSNGSIASFSSDGPTADGRVKPELLARGVDTRTVSTSDDFAYINADGTSLSTPLVAGAVACLVQAHPEWTVEQMRTRLFESAEDFVLYGTFDPLYVRGYGMVDAAATNYRDCNGNGVDDSEDITSGYSGDCNANLIPDDCEPDEDCNNNGIQDICDIADGAADCNGDGVPDECPGCSDNCECAENVPDPCSYGTCQDGFCVVLPNIYADVDHNDVVSLFDLFCILDGLAGDFGTCAFVEDDIHPCGGDGVLNVFDLIAVLNAIADEDPCCGG